MAPLKTAMKHLSLAMKEIEKMPEPVKAAKAVKSKSMGTSPMKIKEPKMKKSKEKMSTPKMKKSKIKMSKDSPSYDIGGAMGKTKF
jgi:hypothetical protein